MRRSLLVLGVVLMQAFGLASPVAAESNLLFGQQHNYSVTMRGNGEAVVTARLVFTNTGDAPQTSFAFEIPKINVGDLIGYQQHMAASCISYGDTKPNVPTTSGTTGSSTLLTRPCLEYDKPDYTQVYGSDNSTYTKLKFKNNGSGKYTFDLPTAVGAQETSALLIGYSGKGYVTQQLGAYKFGFETIKVNERVKGTAVAVSVDSDLYLLDGKSKVNYGSDTKTTTDLAAGVSSAAPSSRQLDSIAYGVGQGGQINKQTSDLASGESFLVRGTYADAAWKLHPWRLVVLGLIILGVAGLLVWLARRQRKQKLSVASRPAVAHDAPVDGPKEPARQHASFVDPLSIVAGLASTLAIGLLTWALVAYGENASYSQDVFTSVIFAIVIILAYVILVAGPVIWLAVRRRDWRVAVYVFVWQVIWLIALLLVYKYGIQPFFINDDPSPIVPMTNSIN